MGTTARLGSSASLGGCRVCYQFFHLASMELDSPFYFAGYRMGDGRSFPRNPRSEQMLVKLADDLHNADKDL